MNAVQEILEPQNWEFTAPKDKLFSSDHVIEAYLRGKKEGLEQAQKLILDKLVQNVNNSGKFANAIIAYLKEQSLHPSSVFLKINSWDDFKLLITLPEEEFISDVILPAYDFVSEFEDKVNEELYHLEVSMTDVNDSLDEKCLKSDGYVLKHKMA
jgi:hypothetical protein